MKEIKGNHICCGCYRNLQHVKDNVYWCPKCHKNYIINNNCDYCGSPKFVMDAIFSICQNINCPSHKVEVCPVARYTRDFSAKLVDRACLVKECNAFVLTSRDGNITINPGSKCGTIILTFNRIKIDLLISSKLKPRIMKIYNKALDTYFTEVSGK